MKNLPIGLLLLMAFTNCSQPSAPESGATVEIPASIEASPAAADTTQAAEGTEGLVETSRKTAQEVDQLLEGI